MLGILCSMILIYFLIFLRFVSAYPAITIDNNFPSMLSREVRKKLMQKMKSGGESSSSKPLVKKNKVTYDPLTSKSPPLATSGVTSPPSTLPKSLAALTTSGVISPLPMLSTSFLPLVLSSLGLIATPVRTWDPEVMLIFLLYAPELFGPSPRASACD